MNDFLNSILANLFDKFKAKNPKVAGIIILVLGTVIYLAENGLGELLGQNMSEVVKWVSVVLIALQGSRTTELLNKPKK